MKVDPGNWPWPNFVPPEVACRGCKRRPCHSDPNGTTIEAMSALQRLRDAFGGPLRINSAYRCPRHNAMVGGAPLSKHKAGTAFDVSIRGMDVRDRNRLLQCAKSVGFKGFGFYGSFLHVDLGPSRSWTTKSGRKVWN